MPGHTFLYSPPVVLVKELIDRRRARRDLLRLVEPRQPRPPPVGRQRRLGSRAARLLDPALLARRDRPTVSALSRGCVIPGMPDVAFINLEYASGVDRARRARLARAEQAAPDDDRRLAEDGRLRRHERRAGADLRLRRDVRDPETFGEYQLSYRTGDIVSPRVDASSRCRSSWPTSATRFDPVRRRDRAALGLGGPPRRRRGRAVAAQRWGPHPGRGGRNSSQLDVTAAALRPCGAVRLPKASSSAIWIAFSAAPLRRLSLER